MTDYLYRVFAWEAKDGSLKVETYRCETQEQVEVYRAKLRKKYNEFMVVENTQAQTQKTWDLLTTIHEEQEGVG